MTELQLKIMQWSDHTLVWWCLINRKWERCVYVTPWQQIAINNDWQIYYNMDFLWLTSREQSFIITWHPYWFERILYLHWQKLPPNDSQQAINFQKIIDYIKQKNQRPLLEKCIDWDEEWQQIVLDFLLSLPK